MPESLVEFIAAQRDLIEQTLDEQLPVASTRPAVIHDAMRYAVLGRGKRIRPILAISAAMACGGDARTLLTHFAALELIHTYSLVHDDLPALDNDDLRRGRKTTHVIFGEAMAILVGDGLLTEAFAWLSRPVPNVDPACQLTAIATVAMAISSQGMIGGQVADIEAERSMSDRDPEELLSTLRFIHENKTGQLITASVLLGGLLGGASSEQIVALRAYGRDIGLAFQIVDDLLDVEQPAEILGKTAGKDVAQGKLTWPALLGPTEARVEVQKLLDRALASADRVGHSMNYLGPIARYICERRY